MSDFEQYLLLSRQVQALYCAKRNEEANDLVISMKILWNNLTNEQQTAFKEACFPDFWRK